MRQVSCIWPNRPELISVSVAGSYQQYFYFPLDGTLVHHRVIPRIKFAGTNLYTLVKIGTSIARVSVLPKNTTQ